MNIPSRNEILQELHRRKYNKIDTLFPDTGDLRRELYVKHLEFFKAGKDNRERLFIAANRVGKSVVGGYETTVHNTGLYPHWWEGKRFDHAVDWWVAGDTSETTRDILQKELLGEISDMGTGLIPKHLILDYTKKRGVPDAIDSVFIKNIWGDKPSKIGFKSYDQGRKKFQGTAKDGIWPDEECPLDVYLEMLIRTMTTNGILIPTFTPLSGLTELIQTFVGEGFDTKAKKFYVNATWDDAPHLTKKQCDELWASIPDYQREARAKGIPALGSGAIYPIEDSRLEVDDFEIPKHWPRIRGLDTGWNHTAAVWMAYNPETKVKYIYSDYKTGHVEPPVHAIAINAKGDWIEGPCDYSGTNQRDGTKVVEEYQDLGVLVYGADKRGKEADIFANYQDMVSGRLKVMKSCVAWWGEKRLYRRNEKGDIVKVNDHLMDAFQYANKVPTNQWTLDIQDEEEEHYGNYSGGGSWMGG